MPIFSTLTAENRAAIADCLAPETYEVGTQGGQHQEESSSAGCFASGVGWEAEQQQTVHVILCM